jgi:class 3 adenylate cyclase/pimeloyl-ACP methyl ester carboxylesterase
VSIAYQVVGDGPVDLVLCPGSITHLEFGWTEPTLSRNVMKLASFARVICFDKRGTGMSDRDVGIPTLEERMDDVRAVMDAAGSDQAAIYGVSEGGAMAALFAATHPVRTTALVLYGAFPRILEAPDWPGVSREILDAMIEYSVAHFGEGLPLAMWAPSVAANREIQEWWGTLERMGASPSSLRALLTLNRDIDIRATLPTIRVPTLVLQRAGDRVVPLAAGEYIASEIPNAKFVALEGEDHLPYGDCEAWIGEIEEFVTGTRHEGPIDRVLASVVFTDIVGSTELAARLGDAEWARLLDRHDEAAKRLATRHRGRLIKSTGDGVLASFDGPTRAARFAADLGRDVESLGLQLHVGIHTGEVEVRGDDIGGIAVHIAARISTLAGAGEILVSRTLRDLTAGSGLVFEDRGVHAFKGLPDEWQVYAVAA